MAHQHETTTTTTTSDGRSQLHDTSHTTGSGLFNNHGDGLSTDHTQLYTSNNAHLGATSGRDVDALSTGSSARNYSAAKMANQHNTLEKDFSRHDRQENGYTHHHLDGAVDSETALKRIQTAGSISISPELFEKLYLSPQNAVKGDLRKTFANPTPVALVGFLISLMPLSMTLMGWQGAGGGGAANIGFFFFFGGMLLLIGGLGEFILGNTFPFVVFSSFAAFYFSFAATLQPFFNAYGAFKNPAVASSTGLESVEFNVGLAFILIAMGILCVVYLICSIRTNLIFFMIFFTLVMAFGLQAGSYIQGTKGKTAMAGKLVEAAGAFQFVTCLFGWYIFFAIMLASVDFPLSLPLVDLSTVVKGASERQKVDHIE